MAQGKSAMMISRPWDWPGLIKSGIDLGVTLVHGINGKLGKALMGVQVDLSQSLLAESRSHKRILWRKRLERVGSCHVDWNPRDDFAGQSPVLKAVRIQPPLSPQ
jgi:hypothetical protein